MMATVRTMLAGIANGAKQIASKKEFTSRIKMRFSQIRVANHFNTSCILSNVDLIHYLFPSIFESNFLTA